jgi:hypothetical protein
MKLNAAGVLAATVLGVLVVGGLIWGGQAIWGGDRLRPLEAATEPATPVATEERTETPAPDDYDAAWNTFLEVIYRCDAMPDLGDDLSLYPPLAEFKALPDGIEQLTTNTYWQERCEQYRPAKRLAEFGPQNLECEGSICVAAVSVHSTGALGNYQEEMIIARPPKYQDTTAPFRLIRGTVELQEEQWVVTKMEIEVLPPLPEASTAP